MKIEEIGPREDQFSSMLPADPSMLVVSKEVVLAISKHQDDCMQYYVDIYAC